MGMKRPPYLRPGDDAPSQERSPGGLPALFMNARCETHKRASDRAKRSDERGDVLNSTSTSEERARPEMAGVWAS